MLGFDGSIKFGNDADGMLYIAKLLYEPGVEIHVADLKGVPRDADSGVTADPASIQELKKEIADYDVEIASAEGPEREFLLKDRDALLKEHAGVVGLGGRPRRLKDPMDSHRISVLQACRRAVDHILKIHPALGNHLIQHLQYGFNCMYEPADPPIYWAT